jgi:hypothetical protein
MMRKIAAALLEVLQMAANAVLLVFTAWIGTISAPVRAWKGSGLASTRAETVAGELQQYLLSRGPWIAMIGLGALLAIGFLRGEKKKLLPLARVVASGAAVLFALWAYMDLPAHRLPRAWDCLFVASGTTFVCTAFMLGGKLGGGSGGGGDAKSSK